MKWSQPADRKVIEAVVAAFRQPQASLRRRLYELSEKQWEQSFYWLDASGMALYLLDRIVSLKLEDRLPAATLARLRQNLADNSARTASMLAEYVELNDAFQQAGIEYCNLKGFTLSPDSCPDPTLRCQLDFDFLVDGKDLETCRWVLTQRGYVLRGSTNTVWEFKTESNDLADIADHYKPRVQRCVEIHFTCDGRAPNMPTRDERLNRLSWSECAGLRVPVLSPVDQFLGQATHLFAHLCSPCTRLAWLLEFKRHLAVRTHEPQFIAEVNEFIATDRNAAIALGSSLLLAADLFGADIPRELGEVAIAGLPEGVALWLERYGRKALLADFPGTKLNLLLREQINLGNPTWKKEKRDALIPSMSAPRIIYVDRNAGIGKRLLGELYQLRFLVFRLRFHLREGMRYAIEAARWRKHLRLHQSGSYLRRAGHLSSLTNHDA